MVEFEVFLYKLINITLSHGHQLITFGIIFLLLEILIPIHKDLSSWNKKTLLDFSYSFLLVLSVAFFYIIPISLASFFLTHLLQSPQTPLLTEYVLYLQILLATIAVDFVGYWRHRVMHSSIMWPVHAVHHSSQSLSWLSLDRMHIIDHFVTVTLNIIVLVILVDPFAAVVTLYMRRVYGQFIHANVNIHYGPLNYIFTSPLFHHWHHSHEPQAMNKNYAVFFSCFDYIFGSFYLPKDNHFPQQLGIRDHLRENLIAHFLHPFKKWLQY